MVDVQGMIFVEQNTRMMKKRLPSVLFLIFAGLLVSSCATNSTLTIQPREEFILGEFQNSRFSAEVTNLSGEEITVSIIDTASGEQVQGFGLPGRNSARITVSKQETVVFTNLSDETVRVRARLGRTVEGMRFQTVPGD
jgi:hypothetical protein